MIPVIAVLSIHDQHRSHRIDPSYQLLAANPWRETRHYPVLGTPRREERNMPTPADITG